MKAARRAWARGDVEEAGRLATDDRQRFLVHYVRGRYEQALACYAAAGRPRSLDEPVAHALLHRDRPAEAAEHLRRRGRRLPPDLVSRLDTPLAAHLTGPTVLPFADHALAQYLPAVSATIDNHPVLAHLDTGGTFLVMGVERARALGITLTPNGRAHHGTTRTTFYTGTAGELTLGGATLTNVPVEAAPTLRGTQDVIIIGTNILQRFLATIDAPAERLALAPRGTPPPPGHRVAFHLWADHFMFARGGFGPHQDLNFFIDSGLVYVIDDRQACLYTTAQHYRRWGMPHPPPHFTAPAPIHLGPLSQSDQFVATTPTRRVPWRDFGGVRIDGLLSWAFLKNYTWTLDFDRHEYTFSQSQ
ncbi:retropepsin-like aspartic protease [Actinophytocola algeriensis]|uniref:Aspartyl protease n=1 Tax=Actinophytocola algeriensis TaxID=1768010 RepID=A0A7W7QDS1_9PSEU|nr:retropepsin-like aspartic protease [Actinophytocola algeriensis]MBB4911588.1 hypothetical protein [Actinophytocola algeriensis]MBE1473424.1 hypothetical protein [Actinophytocola algeriensis]